MYGEQTFFGSPKSTIAATFVRNAATIRSKAYGLLVLPGYHNHHSLSTLSQSGRWMDTYLNPPSTIFVEGHWLTAFPINVAMLFAPSSEPPLRYPDYACQLQFLRYRWLQTMLALYGMPWTMTFPGLAVATASTKATPMSQPMLPLPACHVSWGVRKYPKSQ